jgi:subtilisin-like proprotein convertase family protein
MWHEINNSINEEVVEAAHSESQNIADNSEITSTVNINSDINIEHAEIYVDIYHPRISDLVLTLVSPDGTESLLVNNPGQPLDGGESTLSPDQDGLKFRLSTTNNYGENGTGDWVLKVKDTATGETGILNSWELKLYGKKDNGDDDYIFTDEFGLSNGRTISDDSGNDSINAVSMLTDSTINLNSGTDSNIAGKTVHIDSNTKIEEAYSGDGNDTLIGNELDNVLYGGRGDNNLTGNAGADKFVIFKAINQTDTITDFNVAKSGEKIDLTRFKFDSFSTLTLKIVSEL